MPSRSVSFLAASVVATLALASHGCRTAAPSDLWHPVPDVSPDTAGNVRGNAAAAGLLSNDDQTEIVASVLRAFYYPTSEQARWLDPRPLAHVRSAAADDTVGTDPDFADDVLRKARLRRLCVLGERDDNCRGKPGGVLRFSWPYRVGKDSAIVFATWSRRDSTGTTRAVESEMQFRMKRDSDEMWAMTGKSLVSAKPSPPATRP